MTAIEEHEIEVAEEKWAHEVIEELADEEALEEHFQDCIPGRCTCKEVKAGELVVA
jgi:hypothetical protein